MPESEPKPRLIELVDPGVGQGWKAVLKNGKSVVVHEIPVPAAEAAGAVPRIQRLFEHRHPALSPVLAWGTDPNGLWVAVEPNEGVPLGTILSRGPLTPPAAAALGTALLSGVAALHEAGIAMGGFGAPAVRITGNGEVRLAGHPAGAVRGAPSQSDLRADVRSSGMAICAAFGVDPAGAPAPPAIPPGLVVTMRSMASGAMGPAADRAQGALREMAAALLAPDRMTAAQAELATRSGGREMPPITPFLPKTEAPAPAPPPPSIREDSPLPAAASYDAPPRPPEPKPPTPPTPSPYAPYSEPAPATIVPVPVPFVTNPPAPSAEAPPATPPPPASPFGTNAPSPAPAPPSPFGTSPPSPAPAPAPASPFGTSPPSSPPASPSPFGTGPPAPAAVPASPFGTAAPPPPTWEAPASVSPPKEPPAPTPFVPPPPLYESAPTAAPAPPPPAPAPESTWTPIATPAWTPNDAPAVVASAPTRVPTVPPLTPARKPSVARPAGREPGERPAWMVPAAIAVAILLLLGAGGGIYLATHRGAAVGQATHTPTPPKTSPKASPKATPSPPGIAAVPIYAPASSPPLTSVQFCTSQAPCSGGSTPDTNCKLNGSCHVDFGIYWAKVSLPTLTYSVEFFDRCTGVSTIVLKQTGTPRSSYRSFIPAPKGGYSLTLPSAKAAALVVVAQTGSALAASAPYLVPGSAGTCS